MTVGNILSKRSGRGRWKPVGAPKSNVASKNVNLRKNKKKDQGG